MACGCGDEKIYKEEISSSSNNELTSVVIQRGSPAEHKIQRVPQVLREMEGSSPKSYDPQVISIGPYHHGKEKLIPMEKTKIRLMREYVKSCGGRNEDQIYKMIAELAEEARKCYEDDSTNGFNDTEFSQMMFVDGCFLLHFIFCSMGGKKEELKLKNHEIVYIADDLFLLENQLPFMVLKALMSLNTSFGETQGLENIKRLINCSWNVTPPPESIWEKMENLWAKIIKCKGNDDQKASEWKGEPAHLLELMRRDIIEPNAFNGQAHQGDKHYNFWYSYRSVKELKAAGIIFRPNKSQPNLLTNVSYDRLIVRAILRLPTMTIRDSTKSLLLNLVAYEMCPDSPNDYGVSSYLWLMDLLIDHQDDVKELRQKGILLNLLGSDEQVANLFNEIADNLVPNSNAYATVKQEIEKHCKDKVKVWITEFLHTHFTTPWTALAFIGAIVTIALTFVQSYYAVKPSH